MYFHSCKVIFVDVQNNKFLLFWSAKSSQVYARLVKFGCLKSKTIFRPKEDLRGDDDIVLVLIISHDELSCSTAILLGAVVHQHLHGRAPHLRLTDPVV